MALRAVLFINNGISFFTHILDSSFEINVDLASGFLNAMDSFASNVYGESLKSITLGESFILSLDVPFSSLPGSEVDDRGQIKIVAFADKSNQEQNLELLKAIRYAFFKIYSVKDLSNWDGNVLAFLPFKQVVNQVLNVSSEEIGPTASSSIQENLETQKDKEALVFAIIDDSKKLLVNRAFWMENPPIADVVDKISTECIQSPKFVNEIILPLLQQHFISYTFCQKCNDPGVVESCGGTLGSYVWIFITYFAHENYQVNLPRLISEVQKIATQIIMQYRNQPGDLSTILDQNLADLPNGLLTQVRQSGELEGSLSGFTDLKNYDQLIHALFVERPIAIFTSPENAKNILNQILIFTPHRGLRIQQFPIDVPAAEQVDIVVASPKDLKKYNNYVIADFDKKIVKNGESNGFCADIGKEVHSLKDPSLVDHFLKQKINWLMSKTTLLRNLSSVHTTRGSAGISEIRADLPPEAEKIVLKLAEGKNSVLQNLVDKMMTQIPLKNLLIDPSFIKFSDRKILINSSIPAEKTLELMEKLKKVGSQLLGPRVMEGFFQ